MIYLDNAATTKPSEAALKAAFFAMTETFANPSSLHTAGQAAEQTLKQARGQISFAFATESKNIVFTSGGTEADNLAIFSAFYAGTLGGAGGAFHKRSLYLSTVEHPAVSAPAEKISADGVSVEKIAVLGKDSDFPGMLDPRSIRDALQPDARLVCVLHVNNEIGTIQPIGEIGRVIRDYEAANSAKIFFLSDCVQSFGKLPVDTRAEFKEADYIAISAHKIHGLKGTGALYAKNPEKLHPMVFGGGQEAGARSGTENVAGAAAFGVVAKSMTAELLLHAKAANACRRRLLDGIKAEIPDILINSPEDASITGKPGLCSPYILNVSFLGTRGEVLLHELEKESIFVSTGSACSSLSGGGALAGTLGAIGLSEKEAEGAIRFSFSAFDDAKEMDIVVDVLKKAVARFRSVGAFR